MKKNEIFSDKDAGLGIIIIVIAVFFIGVLLFAAIGEIIFKAMGVN